jgi:hypothetical protein
VPFWGKYSAKNIYLTFLAEPIQQPLPIIKQVANVDVRI